jgi:glucose/arabinose dehydrogenase
MNHVKHDLELSAGCRVVFAAVAAAVAMLLGAPCFAQEPRVPGLTFRTYQLEGEIKAIPAIAPNQTPNTDVVIASVDLRDAKAFPDLPPPIACTVTGFITAAKAGEHVFRLSSDDGSRLIIDGQVVIDHDGRHGASAKTSRGVSLMAGEHELRVEYFDSGGKRSLVLEWQAPGAPGFEVLAGGAVTTEADNARVTSPGVKRIVDERRAGDGSEVAGVHPSYTLGTISPPELEPRVGAMTFLPDGRLVIGVFDPLQRTETDLPDIESKAPDKLYAFSGVTEDDLSGVTMREIATDIFEPLGLCAVGDALYASHRREVTRLLDKDKDGYFETHETVGSGWEGWNYHQFTFGLIHRDGHLYAGLSTAMAPPAWEGMGTNAGPNGPMRGSIIDIDLSSNSVHVMAGGCRTPNGLGFGPEGTILYSDNQGTWFPTSTLTQVEPGWFFGHYNNTNLVPKLAERFPSGGAASAWGDRLRAPTTIYLPQNELANSPTQPLLVEHGPFKGQMFVGEITSGGVRRVSLEKVGGVWQGAAFRFTQGLNCGINRMAWGPDGALYVGGIGASGNWSWNNTRFGLQRLRLNDVVTFEMHDVRATPDGFEVEFSKPVSTSWLADVRNYGVKQWGYHPTAEYGGPKVNEEPLVVTAAAPSADGRKVRLTVPGLTTDRCVLIRTDPKSVDGDAMWSTEAWYTLNRIPSAAPKAAKVGGVAVRPGVVGVGAMPTAQSAVLIGRSAQAAFTTPSTAGTRPTEGRTQAAILEAPAYQEIGSEDLTSRTSFGDCRLHVEWYCPPGGEGQMAGNSGVYLQDRYEIQVLGTPAGSGAPKNDEAGAVYKVKAADVNASTGAGTWQAYDIWFRAPRFGNGKKTSPARITMYWNGVLVHDDVAIDAPTGSAAKRGEDSSAPVQVGPLRLQSHASAAEGPVRFRNVWIAPLEELEYHAGEWQYITPDSALTGWVVRGGQASFRVEDGEVVGESRPDTGNTFLVRAAPYADFELLLEFRQHTELNSGVQVRSHVVGGLDARTGKLMGYQVELDPTSRSYTGGIYEEARRGWLYPLVDAPYARAAYRANAWNSLRVVARGPVISTWVNGVPAANIFDAIDASGHIALQVHDVGKRADPLAVRFRNIRVRELKASSGR